MKFLVIIAILLGLFLFGCVLLQVTCNDYHCFGAALRNNCQSAKLHAYAPPFIDDTYTIEKQGDYCVYKVDGKLEKITEYLLLPLEECPRLGEVKGGATNKDGKCVSVNGLGD